MKLLFPQLIIWLFPIFSMAAFAQNRSEICQINAHWNDPKTKMGSGHMNLGYFAARVDPDDTVKSFKFNDTDLVITTGIRFEWRKFPARGLPHDIVTALNIRSIESSDPFSEESASIAKSPYARKWAGHTVRKQIVYEQKIYTFNLACGGMKSMPLQGK